MRAQQVINKKEKSINQELALEYLFVHTRNVFNNFILIISIVRECEYVFEANDAFADHHLAVYFSDQHFDEAGEGAFVEEVG